MNKIIKFYIKVLLILLIIHNVSAQEQSDRLIFLGDSLFKARDYNAAKETFEKALKLNKNLLSARFGLGRVAIIQRDWKKAAGHFNKILDKNPEDLTFEECVEISEKAPAKKRRFSKK